MCLMQRKLPSAPLLQCLVSKLPNETKHAKKKIKKKKIRKFILPVPATLTNEMIFRRFARVILEQRAEIA